MKDGSTVDEPKIVAEAEEGLFRRLAESAGDGILVADVDANILYANPAWEKLTGYTLSEVKGKNPRIMKSGKTPMAVYKRMWDTITAGRPFLTD